MSGNRQTISFFIHHTCIGRGAPWWQPQKGCSVCERDYLREYKILQRSKTDSFSKITFDSGSIR